MKYKTKLYLLIFSISFLSIFIGIAFLIQNFFQTVLFNASILITSVAGTTAAFLKPQEISQIRTVDDMNTPTYRSIQQQLRKAKNINQRKNIHVDHIYLLRPNPNDPNIMEYVVDAQIGPGTRGFVGYPLASNEVGDLPHHLRDFYSSKKIYSTPWGGWISGFAPILSTDGEYIATIGTDLSANEILHTRVRYILNISYISIGIFCISLIGSFLLSRRLTKSLTSLHHTVEEIAKGNLEVTATVGTRDEFQDLATEFNLMTKGLKERDRLREGFARYVSRSVLEKIMVLEPQTKLEGERRKITVLISDIRQFTHLAESLPPEQTVSILNEYFSMMIEIVFKHQGMCDKFMGDGLVVEFGAPVEDPEQERNAIEAAIEMQKGLAQLNANWKLAHRPTLEIGIGIHTGNAVIGSIGSTKRMDYTAIGETIHIASELQQATKRLHYPLLVSETTLASLFGHFRTKDLGNISIPEYDKQIHIFAIEHAADMRPLA